MTAQLVVPARFNGPPTSGNGGWAAGALAQLLIGADPVPESGVGTAVTVRLRRPPPLDVAMDIEMDFQLGRDGGPRAATASAAGEVVLTATQTTPDEGAALPVLPAVTAQEAAATATGFRGAVDHPFTTCFACGTARTDGLGLAPGPLPDRPDDVACVVSAPPDVDVPVVWAALDCPGAWALDVAGRPVVLGTMTASVARVPEPGEVCVVVGRALRREGRKAFTATTLWGEGDEPLARATAVWLEVDPAAFA